MKDNRQECRYSASIQCEKMHSFLVDSTDNSRIKNQMIFLVRITITRRKQKQKFVNTILTFYKRSNK